MAAQRAGPGCWGRIVLVSSGAGEEGWDGAAAAAELRGRGMPEFIGRLAASEPQREAAWVRRLCHCSARSLAGSWY
jgi:NAD(P)H-hydrate repair Nnr-like enzyme with NAD(P)H-hydrate epimerase domain